MAGDQWCQKKRKPGGFFVCGSEAASQPRKRGRQPKSFSIGISQQSSEKLKKHRGFVHRAANVSNVAITTCLVAAVTAYSCVSHCGLRQQSVLLLPRHYAAIAVQSPPPPPRQRCHYHRNIQRVFVILGYPKSKFQSIFTYALTRVDYEKENIMCDVEEKALGVRQCLLSAFKGLGKSFSHQNRGNEKQQHPKELVCQKA